QAEDGIRDFHVTGVQTCALPIFPDAFLDMSRHYAMPSVTTLRPSTIVRPGGARHKALQFELGRGLPEMLWPETAAAGAGGHRAGDSGTASEDAGEDSPDLVGPGRVGRQDRECGIRERVTDRPVGRLRRPASIACRCRSRRRRDASR